MNNQNRTTVHLLGGLGNQLFGLHFGASVSFRLKNGLQLSDSMIPLGSNKSRTLQVSNFKLNDLDISYRRNNGKIFNNLKHFSLVRKFRWIFFNRIQKPVTEKETQHINFKFKPGQKFIGYFQDWFYADFLYENGFKIQSKITSEYTSELINLLGNNEIICVHVRLGDYLEFPNIFKILPEDYFIESINFISKGRNFKIWIFVEDQIQAAKYYPKLIFQADKVFDRTAKISDIESFAILAESKYLIASNSTFSLWAAWLVNKNNGTVVVPKQLCIQGVPDALADSRWHRCDLSSMEIESSIQNLNLFAEKKADFLNRF
jgi:hypothetical protein